MSRQYVTWTNKQLAKLREHYLTMSREDLERELAPHPWRSIVSMANASGMRGRRAGNRDWNAICSAHVMQTGLFVVHR